MWWVNISKKSDKQKPTLAVHKFSSCDGCQLAFLNLGEALLSLSQLVDIRHFAEAGLLGVDTEVDIAFVEGSVTTSDEADRIKEVRANSHFLVTMGACATSGGLQALRNNANADEWLQAVYPSPEFIDSLATSTPIKDHVRVDLELWGCPVNGEQVLMAVRSLLFGVKPAVVRDSVCLECKRQNNVCVMIAQNKPCMGPVTQTGCGALCPSVGRDCYACYGPSENPNSESLIRRFEGFGLMPEEIARRFLSINNNAPVFSKAGQGLKAGADD
jgi:coenzyme F420-reducing hydrogenase gamma subunit